LSRFKQSSVLLEFSILSSIFIDGFNDLKDEPSQAIFECFFKKLFKVNLVGKDNEKFLCKLFNQIVSILSSNQIVELLKQDFHKILYAEILSVKVPGLEIVRKIIFYERLDFWMHRFLNAISFARISHKLQA
jgi:hypothetical protein